MNFEWIFLDKLWCSLISGVCTWHKEFLFKTLSMSSFLSANLWILQHMPWQISQGRETAKAFPLYTMKTERNFPFRSHCIQWERFCRFSSLKFLIRVFEFGFWNIYAYAQNLATFLNLKDFNTNYYLTLYYCTKNIWLKFLRLRKVVRLIIMCRTWRFAYISNLYFLLTWPGLLNVIWSIRTTATVHSPRVTSRPGLCRTTHSITSLAHLARHTARSNNCLIYCTVLTRETNSWSISESVGAWIRPWACNVSNGVLARKNSWNISESVATWIGSCNVPNRVLS